MRCIHSESPQRNKLCVMPYACKNRCAYVAHINLWNIKRAQKHFPLSEEDVVTWRLTRWDVGEGHRWRSVDWCEKQPFVQVQLIKAEDGGKINSKFKINCSKANKLSGEVFLYIQKYHQRWREHCAIRYTLFTLLTLFWAKSLNVAKGVGDTL